MKAILFILLIITTNNYYGQYYNGYKISNLESSAETGNGLSQLMLGEAYSTGKGVPQNYEKAFYWYEKASNSKTDFYSGGGEWSLGRLYFYGNGVKQNYKNAFFHYKRGAEKGDKVAQYDLAICYYNGYGIERSLVDAVYWFKKSCENKNLDGCNMVSKIKKYKPQLFN
jgi:TPR repeat protein